MTSGKQRKSRTSSRLGRRASRTGIDPQGSLLEHETDRLPIIGMPIIIECTALGYLHLAL
jgi:hypothetical protein